MKATVIRSIDDVKSIDKLLMRDLRMAISLYIRAIDTKTQVNKSIVDLSKNLELLFEQRKTLDPFHTNIALDLVERIDEYEASMLKYKSVKKDLKDLDKEIARQEATLKTLQAKRGLKV